MRTIRIVLALAVALLLSQGPLMRLSPSLSAQQPILQVSPTSLEFQGQAGGPTPAPQALTIANAGGGLMEWHASADVEWIILGGTEGQLSGGRVIQLWVFVDAKGLAAGEYEGTITIEAPGAQGSPVQVAVTFEIRLICLSGPPQAISLQEAINRGFVEIELEFACQDGNFTIFLAFIATGAADRDYRVVVRAGDLILISLPSMPLMILEFDQVTYFTIRCGEQKKITEQLEQEQLSSKGWCVPGDCITIQECVDKASPRDIIVVSKGTYAESLAINKSLYLKGASRDTVTVKGAEEGKPVIRIESDSEIQVTIEGLTATEARVGCGIQISGKALVAIKNSQISGNDFDGICIQDSAQVTIQGNKVFDNEGYGVALELKACGYEEDSFKGGVRGSGNEIHDNGKGDVCPEELEFLMTEEGGQYP